MTTAISNVAAARRPMREAILWHARYSLGESWETANPLERYRAVALALRERLVDGVLETEERYRARDPKRVYYLSMEFLIGRSLGNNLVNLGLFDEAAGALEALGADLEELREGERDAALGNGGLGRLAACFLDSMATLGIAGIGYGINYEFGLFKQEIDNGRQKEKPDQWQAADSPWQIERADQQVIVPVFGRIEHGVDRDGNYNPMWLDWKILVGIPHDLAIAGYGGRTVNVLRLFSARSSNEFDMKIFNEGDYLSAVESQVSSETISKVLYPSDSFAAGRELRLMQEYFLVSCALQDIVKRHLSIHPSLDNLPAKAAIQLNDTHPSLAVAELMRVLIDEHAMAWEKAWEITVATCAYTNHTLLPEALERWSVPLFEHVLPRHLQIIYEINRRFLGEVSERWPGDDERLRRMSLIEEGGEKQVRMAHLAIVGGHSVNGVAALHSELVKTSLVPDFAALWPGRFNNKTNGVTQRRWLLKTNPKLSDLLKRTIDDAWIVDLDRLRGLEKHADDTGFRAEFLAIKHANKEKLAETILETTRVKVDPSSLFDVQAKRIHEYKRQLLNVLGIVHEYLSIVEDGVTLASPRTHILAGKAAPGYYLAKLIIKLANDVAAVVNQDPRVGDQLKVAFIPDYKVSVAERIIPGADLSEQISTAGKEASGTSNMKFAMNGALTIGTLDGANIEILEEVGEENIYIFGLNAEEIADLHRRHAYDPRARYDASPIIRRAIDSLVDGRFAPKEPERFRPIWQRLMEWGDEYFHLADFEAYVATQARVAQDFQDRGRWARMAILNVARVGKFSSDRTIREYARDIWGVEPVL